MSPPDRAAVGLEVDGLVGPPEADLAEAEAALAELLAALLDGATPAELAGLLRDG